MIDKIKKAFEYWIAPNHTEKEYNLLKRCFRDGYLAGHKWQTRNDKQEARIIDQDEEIKKLRGAIRCICDNFKVNRKGIAIDLLSDIDVWFLLNLIGGSNYDKEKIYND